jgi:hypothetical protein
MVGAPAALLQAPGNDHRLPEAPLSFSVNPLFYGRRIAAARTRHPG